MSTPPLSAISTSPRVSTSTGSSSGVLPSGAAGAVTVAAWLVEWKQRDVENMAPVLTMLFTPLFAVMLAGAAVTYAATGFGDAFDRELLSVFDALLVVVLALVPYGMSARDPSTSPNWMDRIQLVAVVSALVLDLMVLGSMIARSATSGSPRTERQRSASTSSSS